MSSDEFMDLALRVTEGTVTPDERARFEEELVRQPQRRDEWLALRRDLQAMREAAGAAAALSGPTEAIPARHLAALMGQTRPAVVPRRPWAWLAGGLAAAAAIGVAWWLGSMPERAGSDPAEGARLAFVVPRGGEVSLATPTGRRSTTLPVALTGSERVTIPSGREAWLLTPDGRVTAIRGTYQASAVKGVTGTPVARSFTTPLALLGAGPGPTRGGEGLRLLSPRGATESTTPAVTWVAEPGQTYEVELRDALQHAAQPARVQGVVPPLAFSRLQPAPLAVDGIYILSIHETGRPATAVSERFMVVRAGESISGGDHAALMAAAFQALASSPARTGDAWLLLQQLPADWRESEPGRRLAAAVGAP